MNTNQLIQEIINESNGKLVLEEMKFMTQVPSTFFLKYHDHMRIIRAGTGVNNTRLEQLLHYFIYFIILGKGMVIRENIGRKTTKNKGNGMIMNTMRRRKSLRGGKNNLICGKDSLEVRMHPRCLNDLNRMELRNNTRVAFLKEILHAMGTNDLRRTNCETLELIPLYIMLELHG
jgi:hypothetical protein